MACFFRPLVLALLLAPSLGLTGCKDSNFPTPQSQTRGAIVGYATPFMALTGVEAKMEGQAVYTATLVTTGSGAYTFSRLPVGRYTLSYTVADGYVTPPNQTVTVSANATLASPSLAIRHKRFDVLTRHRWRITRAGEVQTYPDSTVTLDYLRELGPCIQNTFLQFNPDQTFTQDPDNAGCNSSAYPLRGIWALDATATTLTVNSPQGNGSWPIKQLTDTTLETEFRSNNVNYSSVATFVYTAF